MHDVIRNGLEEYLSGASRQEFRAHLAECGECRREVDEIRGISGLFGSLRQAETDALPEIAPGFYYRLSEGIEARKAASPWNLFSISAAFGRRVAFGALMTLAIVGGVLISQEMSVEPEPADPGPIAIMASHDHRVTHDDGSDRDHMLLTLATYNH